MTQSTAEPRLRLQAVSVDLDGALPGADRLLVPPAHVGREGATPTCISRELLPAVTAMRSATQGPAAVPGGEAGSIDPVCGGVKVCVQGSD